MIKEHTMPIFICISKFLLHSSMMKQCQIPACLPSNGKRKKKPRCFALPRLLKKSLWDYCGCLPM